MSSVTCEGINMAIPMHTLLLDKEVDVADALRDLGILVCKQRDALDEEARSKLLRKVLDRTQILDTLTGGKKINFDTLEPWDRSKKLVTEFKQFSFLEGLTGQTHSIETHKAMQGYVDQILGSVAGMSLETQHKTEERPKGLTPAVDHFHSLRQSFQSIGNVIDEQSNLSVNVHL